MTIRPTARVHVLVGCIAVATTLAVAVICIARGLNITTDSAQYMFAARAIVEGAGYLGSDGQHLVDFPPLYSGFVATAMAVGGLSAPSAVIATAMVSVCAAISGFGFALHRLIGQESWWTLLGTMVFALSSTVLVIATSAWSEAPFLALVVWAAAIQIRPPADPRLYTLVLVLLLSAASLTRTAGFFAVGAAAITLLLQRRPGAAVVTAVLAPLPAIAWAAINMQVAGDATVERGPSADSALVVVATGLRWMLQWFSFGFGPQVVQLITAVFVVFLVGLIIAVGHSWHFRELVPAVYFVAFFLGTFLTRVAFALDDLGTKLLAPIAPYVFLILFSGLALNRLKRASFVAAGVLFFATLSVSASQVFTVPKSVNQLELMAATCDSIGAGTVFSDESAKLALVCDRPVLDSPRTHLYASSRTVDERKLLTESASYQCVSIVTFGNEPGHFITIDELLDLVNAEVTSGGAIPVIATACPATA